MNIKQRCIAKSNRMSLVGMTSLELVVAITMLIVFTSVVAMVSGVIIRFLSPVSGVGDESGEISNGLLVDQQELRQIMQRYVALLEQPGISRERLLGDDPSQPQIAYSLVPGISNPAIACTADPIRIWNLPLNQGNIGRLPPGYRLCVSTTSFQEASLNQLLAKTDTATPGIYVLMAIPEMLTTRQLPIRLLFCRPKPFC